MHDGTICETFLLSRAPLDTMPAKRVQKLLFKSNDVVDVDFSSLRADDWCDDLRAFEADCMEKMRVHKERALSDARVLSPEPNARARGARELDAACLFSPDAHEREFSSSTCRSLGSMPSSPSWRSMGRKVRSPWNAVPRMSTSISR